MFRRVNKDATFILIFKCHDYNIFLNVDISPLISIIPQLSPIIRKSVKFDRVEIVNLYKLIEGTALCI